MQLIDLTYDDPHGNLALDEALLVKADHPETLRFWRPAAPVVVAGRSSHIEQEINASACQAAGVPILRRVSGGATIVTGPGCLMYGVVLDADHTPEATDIDAAHRYVLGRMVDALSPLCPGVVDAGTSDLAIRVGSVLRKFSGNSVRRVRNRLLYHGTLMYDFDLSLIDRLLKTPPRQPDYRAGRSHDDFVANLPVAEDAIATAIAAVWQATPAEFPDAVAHDVDQLVSDKYADPQWTHSR